MRRLVDAFFKVGYLCGFGGGMIVAGFALHLNARDWREIGLAFRKGGSYWIEAERECFSNAAVLSGVGWLFIVVGVGMFVAGVSMYFYYSRDVREG